MYVQIPKIQRCFLREDRSHNEPDPAVIRDFLWSFSPMFFIFLSIPDILFKRDCFTLWNFLCLIKDIGYVKVFLKVWRSSGVTGNLPHLYFVHFLICEGLG